MLVFNSFIFSEPSSAPKNIISKKENETTYTISWDPLSRELSNGDVIAYEVSQTLVSGSRTARAISSAAIVLENTTDTFKVLSDLKACSKYSVQVRAYTTAGPGVFGSIPEPIVTSGRMCSIWLTPIVIFRIYFVLRNTFHLIVAGRKVIHRLNQRGS